MQKHKALFLDRDGVINAEDNYVFKPDQVKFIPGLFDFCRKAVGQGYKIIVITNQAGIARGLYTEPQFNAFMRWMGEQFAVQGCPWSGYYFCPHHPDVQNPFYRKKCNCRKPKPGMIIKACEEHAIDPAQSVLIGDKPSDIEAGKAARVGRLELFRGVWPNVIPALRGDLGCAL